MHARSFRTFLIFAFLICLTILSSALPLALSIRAMSSSAHQQHSIPPSGHGIAIPHMQSTTTTPQVHGMGGGQIIHQPSPSRRAHVPPPQNVVRVPPADFTNPSAIEGLSQDVTQQPDANGAEGVDNYLETVNREFAIYSGGTQQYTTTFNSWFRDTSDIFYDPVVTWDHSGNRFIFSVDTSKRLVLSVAQQSNALGNYCFYNFPPLTSYGADFDKLGVSGGGVYLSANLQSSTGNVVSNELFFANRGQMENCQNTNYTYWIGLTNPDGSIAEAIVPARQDSSAGGVEYLVNSYPGGSCQLTLWTLTTSSDNLSNTTVPTQCYSPPLPAKQKGSSVKIAAGDSSLDQASYINGLLTVAAEGSYDWGDGNGLVGIVEWFVLNPSSASVFSQGAFGTPGFWLFYPAAVENYKGNMLFVYNASGPTIYPSIWYVNQTFIGTQSIAQGAGPYGTSGVAPWGDYQSAWLDVKTSSPNAFVVTGEYATATNSWATKFAHLIP